MRPFPVPHSLLSIHCGERSTCRMETFSRLDGIDGENMLKSKIRFFLMGLMAFVSVSLSGMHAMAAETIVASTVSLDGGYRIDDLDWNIGGGIFGPDVISELTWDDLEIYQIRGSGTLDIGNNVSPYTLHLRGMVGYGWIVDGENQDSDFDGDNRTDEFSRSNNEAGDGEVIDASAGIGPRFKVQTGKLAITPLVGFSYHEQNLTMTDGFQTLSRPDIDPLVQPTGPFDGLDSTYETQWYGPWVGLDVAMRPVEKFTLSGSFEYHWADFDAVGKWNLRTDLAQPKSFEHKADGDGVVLSLGGEYALTPKWSVHLNLDYRDWRAEDGIIRFFFASGNEVVQRLNEVNWQSRDVLLGATYRFL